MYRLPLASSASFIGLLRSAVVASPSAKPEAPDPILNAGLWRNPVLSTPSASRRQTQFALLATNSLPFGSTATPPGKLRGSRKKMLRPGGAGNVGQPPAPPRPASSVQ